MIKPTKEFLETFKNTKGAIGVAEAIAIINIASQAPLGLTYLDLGSHAGKAAMAAAYGLTSTPCPYFGHPFYLVDPIYDFGNLEAWKHSEQGHPDFADWLYAKEINFNDIVIRNIAKVSCGHLSANLCGSYSEAEIVKHDKIGYCFVDSDTHQGGLVLREAKLLEDRVVPYGIIAFHDFGNQFREPREAAEYLVGTGKYYWVDIDWGSIFDYVRENNLEDGNDSWHNKGSEEFPKFVGAVIRK